MARVKTQESEDNCWMNVTEDPGGMVTNTGGKRLTLKYSSSGTGKTAEKVVESQRLIKTTKPMLLHEKD